jgi:hypothetical protein
MGQRQELPSWQGDLLRKQRQQREELLKKGVLLKASFYHPFLIGA